MKVTIRDIAKVCKISPATVSNVINNKGRVKQGTRDMVMDTLKRMNYDPYKTAPWLKKAGTRLIGLVTPTTTTELDPFYNRAITSAKTATGKYGYNCVLYWDQEVVQKTTESRYLSRGIIPCDGLIFFCPFSKWDQALAKLKKWGIPAVLIRRETRVPGIPVLTDSDLSGATLAIEHLHRLGHTRIGLVPLRGEVYTIKERTRAYTDYIQQHGLEHNPAWVFNRQETPELNQWLQQVMAAQMPPTAFFCESDDLAMTLIRALAGMALRVPEDIAVVGYDNEYSAGRFHPPLTTINVPVREMIEAACSIIVEQLRNDEPGRTLVEKMEFKNELVIRESCGGNKTRTA